MKHKIAFARIIFILIGLIGFGLMFWIPDEKAIEIDIFADLLGVISILCGVLIAVVTVFLNAPEGLSWKAIVIRDESVEPKVYRLLMLLYLYLLSITLILICRVLCPLLSDDHAHFALFKKAAIGLSLLSVWLSFGLPRLISEAFKK